MTLVNFGWLSAQKYFKESVNSDIRRTLQEEQLSIMDNDIVPFGAISGYQGSAGDDSEMIDGDLWVTDRSKFTMENMEWETLSNKHRL
jgi:hypothetical protein